MGHTSKLKATEYPQSLQEVSEGCLQTQGKKRKNQHLIETTSLSSTASTVQSCILWEQLLPLPVSTEIIPGLANKGCYLSFSLSSAKYMRTKWRRSKYFCRCAIFVCLCFPVLLEAVVTHLGCNFHVLIYPICCKRLQGLFHCLQLHSYKLVELP